MPLVPGTYAPPALNPLFWPVGGPPIDNDPASPTYGQPTYSNVRPPARAPEYDTTAKGNAGQPAPSVPTTQDSGASFTMDPGQPKTPPVKAKAKAPEPADEVPDYLGNLQPQVDEHGKPLAPQAPAAPSAAPTPSPDEVPDYLGNLRPQVDAHGQPLTPAPPPGGQYMFSAKSPGAQAVGTPIAEDRVPGLEFQLAVHASPDAAQRARIAASQLGVPLDSIIIGPGGRMAAVDPQGQPYYIEPQPVFASNQGSTKPPPGEPTTGAGTVGGPVSGNIAAMTGTPGARATATVTEHPAWQPLGAFQSPYDRTVFMPSGAGGALSPGNLVRGGAAAAPGGVQNLLTAGPALVADYFGGPAAGAATYGGMDYATGAVRQRIANLLDPNSAAAPAANTWDRAGNAALNAALWFGGSVGGRLFNTAAAPSRGWFQQPGGTPGAPEGFPSFSRELPPNNLYGPLPARQGVLAPWEPMSPWEQRLLGGTMPGDTPAAVPAPTAPGASTAAPVLAPGERLRLQPPAPAEAPSVRAEAADLNPAGEAAAQNGPYAPSTAQEVSVQPTVLPPQRMPIFTQAQADARADEIFRHFAAGGNTTPDMTELVPGSPASISQRTGNAGLNALERYMRNLPETKNVFDVIDQRQSNAQRAFAGRITGTPDDIAAAQAQREATTGRNYNAAFKDTTPVDAQPLVDRINTQLTEPAAKTPVVARALRQARDLLYQHDADGNVVLGADGNPQLETDPEMLWGARRAIRYVISEAASSAQGSSRTIAEQLMPLRDALDRTITEGAPNYPAFRDQYAEMSRPIDEMTWLQQRQMTDANGYPTLAKVDATIKAIENQNLKPGTGLADSVSDETRAQLVALRDDLRRRANLGKGKALGSNTAENFAGGAVLNALTRGASGGIARIGAGFGGPLGNALQWGGEHALTSATQRSYGMVRDALIKRILNENGLGERALYGAGRP
jgi:hypothetical protein